RAFGLSLAAPGQLPLWSVIIGRGVAAVLLVVAGVAALRRWPADRWPPALVLALPSLAVTAAIVLAAAVQPLLPPRLHSPPLSAAFYAMLLTALAAESREDLRAVREANAQLVLLRDADMARATAEERARLAREIHDGLSQELWLARLKQGRLLQEPDLSESARSLAGEVSGAIEAALAEARQAIVALRPSEEGTFAEVVERYVADFGDRFGIRTECICDATRDQLGFRAQAELLPGTPAGDAGRRPRPRPVCRASGAHGRGHHGRRRGRLRRRGAAHGPPAAT